MDLMRVGMVDRMAGQGGKPMHVPYLVKFYSFLVWNRQFFGEDLLRYKHSEVRLLLP